MLPAKYRLYFHYAQHYQGLSCSVMPTFGQYTSKKIQNGDFPEERDWNYHLFLEVVFLDERRLNVTGLLTEKSCHESVH